MTPSRTISVRVCHDDAMVSAGLLDILERAPGVEGMSGEAPDTRVSDVVVANYSRGLAMLAPTGAKNPPDLAAQIPTVIIVTRRAGEMEISRALAQGARGYLLRHSDPGELIDAVRYVTNGGVRYLCRQSTVILERGGPPANFTSREEDILRFLVAGECNKGIARQLNISAHTVKSHISTICAKLQAESRSQIAMLVNQRGLITLDRTAGPRHTGARQYLPSNVTSH